MSQAPTAGSRAANQYGEFTVHFASDKQQAFIRSLASKRVLPVDVPKEHQQALDAVAKGELNKKHASRTIDWLMTLPAQTEGGRPVTDSRPTRPATDKQVALIEQLAAERVWRDDDMEVTTFRKGNNVGIWAVLMVTAGCSDEVTPAEASQGIDHLFASPKPDRRSADVAARNGEPEAGMYRDGDTIYRVYLGQQSGRMLVKRLVETGDTWVDPHGETKPVYEYEYVGAASYKLPATATPLPLEEAKAWGRMTSSCCRCGARLDVPESVDAGIGPVCARKY